MFTTWFILLVIGGVTLAQSDDTLVVPTDQGPVLGRKDVQGGLYNFLNIPYATAPTGENKFKAPLPPPNWTEPFEGTNKMIACMQAIEFPGSVADFISMEEDCLIANIYVPDTTETNLPVLVVVHGGAYHIMFSGMAQFSSLVRTKRIIVVTFNYRLGLPGFLCLGTKDIPGNAGMKDQVALLRWVNRNIASFGGNPDDVTITGCSAGGGSVDFLTVSPMTSGLFKKAIPESGAVLGCVGTQVDPVENAKLYAKHLNFENSDDFKALEEFYKTAPYELLFSGHDFIMNRDDTLFLFSPCVERDTGTGEETFINDAPWNYLINGSYEKVPLFAGFAEMEGLFRIPLFDSYKSRMNEKFSDFLPAELQFENEAQRNEVAQKVKEFYFGNETISEQTILSYVDYFTDIMFAYPMIRVANLKASKGDTIYLYEYSFVDDNTEFVPHTMIKGANHCEQLNIVMDDLLVDVLFPAVNHTEAFLAMRETMRELWANFIISGNPTPDDTSLPIWRAVNGYASPYMALNETMGLQENPLLEPRIKFWDSIYEEHYRTPVPPSVPDSAALTKSPIILIAFTLLISSVLYL